MSASESGSPSKTDTVTFQLPRASSVAPFPRAKFETFISYLKIQSRDYGRIPFRLIGSQRYILDEMEKAIAEGMTTIVVLKSRQQGSTTLFIAIDMFYAFEHGGLLGTFILHEEKALAKWRATIDIFLETMPNQITVNGKKTKFKPRTEKHNRDILLFSNDSSFSYLIAGTQEERSGGLGRSQSSNYVHGTECAFYGNEDDIKAFKSSVSSIYEHRLQIWETTANGFNHFYDQYQSAKSSPTARAIFSGWWRDERCQFHVDDARFGHYGRDRLSRLERGRVRAVKERYDFDISMQQIAWYRAKLDEFSGDQSTMDAEFPFTEEDAFQSTGAKYFTSSVLTEVMREARRHPMQAYRYRMTRRWDDTTVQGPLSDRRAELKIWEHASKFGVYVVSCDPAYGSSDQADNNCVQVWRCYAECMVQVAEFCSRDYTTYQIAWVIAHLAGFYGKRDCRVIIEINGPGKAVFSELERTREYVREIPSGEDNFEVRNCLNNLRYFYYTRIDTVGGSDLAYHMVTTDDIKRMLMARFKDAVELNRMQIRSQGLIEEMRTLVNQDGAVAADGGKNDDRVMAAAMAHECWRKWLWSKLRGEGLTRAYSASVEERGGELPVDRVISNYLKRCNIEVPI